MTPRGQSSKINGLRRSHSVGAEDAEHSGYRLSGIGPFSNRPQRKRRTGRASLSLFSLRLGVSAASSEAPAAAVVSYLTYLNEIREDKEHYPENGTGC